jgi:uncharacterized protein
MAEDWARPLVHWEIQGRDQAGLKAFYSAMFNWEIAEGPVGLFAAGVGPPEPGPNGHIAAGDAPRVVPYIQVMDLRASMNKAKDLGGAILAEPFDVPNGPTIARIADPEGNHIGLVQQ